MEVNHRIAVFYWITKMYIPVYSWVSKCFQSLLLNVFISLLWSWGFVVVEWTYENHFLERRAKKQKQKTINMVQKSPGFCAMKRLVMPSLCSLPFITLRSRLVSGIDLVTDNHKRTIRTIRVKVFHFPSLDFDAFCWTCKW